MHNVRRGPHPSRNKLLCGTPCPTGKGTISEVIVKFSLQWGTHLISQHLNELNPKFQCENQLGFDMSKHSRWNRSCSKRQQAREINFHSFPDFPIRAATNQGVDTQSYIPILEALLHSFNCHFQNLGECRQHIQIYADPLDCKCHQITNRNSLISMQSLDAVSDTCTFIDTTLLAFNKPLFQQHLSIWRTISLFKQIRLKSTFDVMDQSLQNPNATLCIDTLFFATLTEKFDGLPAVWTTSFSSWRLRHDWQDDIEIGSCIGLSV